MLIHYSSYFVDSSRIDVYKATRIGSPCNRNTHAVPGARSRPGRFTPIDIGYIDTYVYIYMCVC